MLENSIHFVLQELFSLVQFGGFKDLLLLLSDFLMETPILRHLFFECFLTPATDATLSMDFVAIIAFEYFQVLKQILHVLYVLVCCGDSIFITFLFQAFIGHLKPGV